jgi:hypothetical protein
MDDTPPLAALGLGEDATPEATRAAAERLRAHIEARASASSDATFVRARQAELNGLDALMRLAQGSSAVASAAPSWLILWSVAASLASLGLAVALWLGLPGEVPVAAPALARVIVSADPPSAEVTLLAQADEQIVARGSGSGAILEAPAGSYILHVASPDCPDIWTRTLSLEPGSESEFAARICTGAGVLVVRSNVAGDRLQINGIDVGSTGATFHALAVGRHQVTINKPGYVPWTADVKILPDESLTLNAELEPEGGERSSGQAAQQRPQPPAQPAEQAPSSAAAPSARAPASAGRRASEAPSAGPSETKPGRRTVGNAAGGNRKQPPLPRKDVGGSKSWHDAVRQRLISEYDRNQSRTLDTPEELSSIPCQVWQSIEASYETGGLGVSMTRLYGFDGSDAPTNTLGVTYPMRGYAYDAMTQCGLKRGGD